jgi:PTS system mannose-specific IIB component
MIALVRVDNRLVHGQVLEAWVPRLHVTRIVVADDDAAASHLAKAAMTLALPPELPGAVVPVAQVDFADLAGSHDTVLLLFRDVEGVVRARAAGLTPALGPHVNLGNVHYMPQRRPVTPSVFLSAEELAQIEAIAAAGFDVDARAVPGDPPIGPGELRHRYDAARGTG